MPRKGTPTAWKQVGDREADETRDGPHESPEVIASASVYDAQVLNAKRHVLKAGKAHVEANVFKRKTLSQVKRNSFMRLDRKRPKPGQIEWNWSRVCFAIFELQVGEIGSDIGNLQHTHPVEKNFKRHEPVKPINFEKLKKIHKNALMKSTGRLET